MIFSMVKNILKDAGRYEDVVGILKGIISDTEYSYPVDAYVIKTGETLWRVDGDIVRSEAEKLLRLIEEGVAEENDSFMTLYEYINTHTNAKLHNYAIAISHRHEPDVDMEELRSWLVLWNLIICYHDTYVVDTEWSVSEGWRKQR